MIDDSTTFVHCLPEDLTLLYVVIGVIATSTASIIILALVVVTLARRARSTLQTPLRSWITSIDLLMGSQVRCLHATMTNTRPPRATRAARTSGRVT